MPLAGNDVFVCHAGVKAAEPQMKEQAAKVQTFSKSFYENLSKEMEQVLKSAEAGTAKSKHPPRP